jgi:hypothetical protein
MPIRVMEVEMVKVIRAENGWIVEYPNPNMEGVLTEVFEIPECSKDPEKEMNSKFLEVLRCITSNVGPYENSFGANEIHLSLGPGDEYCEEF